MVVVAAVPILPALSILQKDDVLLLLADASLAISQSLRSADELLRPALLKERIAPSFR